MVSRRRKGKEDKEVEWREGWSEYGGKLLGGVGASCHVDGE